MRSDFLLVRYPGDAQWQVFRDRDILTRGFVWIEEDSGRFVRTELQIGGRSSPISVITEYQFDEELGVNVPVTMRDWYPDGAGEMRGVATYGRFRRFQVTTEEAIK